MNVRRLSSLVSAPACALALVWLFAGAGCHKDAAQPPKTPASVESVAAPAAGPAVTPGSDPAPRAGGATSPKVTPDGEAKTAGRVFDEGHLAKLNDPKTCARCHKAIYAEWTESMHARAHHTKDPIYAGMRAIRVAREGAQVAGRCALCHTPRDTAPASESVLAFQGVGCVGCHTVQAVHLAGGAKGAKAFHWGPPGRMFGPHDLERGRSRQHETGPAPAHMKTGGRAANDLCLACHGEITNPKGVPMCATGVEHAGLTGPAAGKRCVDCHMPRVAGKGAPGSGRKDHASHKFLGPHRAWIQGDGAFLATAVGVDAAWDPKGLGVTLRNLTGHAFPTGFPGRVVLLKAVGFDEAGAKVWENCTDAPMKQSPASVLNQVFVGEDGVPTLPPLSAKRARDTRLAPGGARKIRFDLPENVVKVELRLLMRLVPPPVVEKFRLDPAKEGSPRVFFQKVVTRP